MKSYYAYTMAYRKSPTLFRTVPSPTPYGLLFPKIGGSQPQLKTVIASISGTGKATDCNFGRYLHRVHPNKAHEKFERKARAFTKLLLITNRNSDRSNALSIGTNRPWMTLNCCKQWRRAFEALEARALPDSIATVVNTPCPGKKITVFSASLQQM